MKTIGERVREAIQASGYSQRQVAKEVGMTPDALSRALSGQRGFAALEIAALADVLNRDVHFLITGEPDPYSLVLSARHTFDGKTGERAVAGLAGDTVLLEKLHLAYRQALS